MTEIISERITPEFVREFASRYLDDYLGQTNTQANIPLIARMERVLRSFAVPLTGADRSEREKQKVRDFHNHYGSRVHTLTGRMSVDEFTPEAAEQLVEQFNANFPEMVQMKYGIIGRFDYVVMPTEELEDDK